MTTSSPGSTTARSVAIIASVAPQVTVMWRSGSTSTPLYQANFSATTWRSRGEPQGVGVGASPPVLASLDRKDRGEAVAVGPLRQRRAAGDPQVQGAVPPLGRPLRRHRLPPRDHAPEDDLPRPGLEEA